MRKPGDKEYPVKFNNRRWFKKANKTGQKKMPKHKANTTSLWQEVNKF